MHTSQTSQGGIGTKAGSLGGQHLLHQERVLRSAKGAHAHKGIHASGRRTCGSMGRNRSSRQGTSRQSRQALIVNRQDADLLLGLLELRLEFFDTSRLLFRLGGQKGNLVLGALASTLGNQTTAVVVVG